MLEGREISEALFSETIKNKDFRIDSQYYTQVPFKNPILKYKKIGEVIHSSQYGISIEMNEDGHGYPIYRMNELHNMLCDLEVNKYANITHDEYQRFALKNRDVLFNRTNSFEWVGRTGVYYQNDDVERTFASYLVRFNPIESDILPEYLCAFLNSKEGVRDIKRRARQSINQTNVNPEEVKEIEIPVLDMDFQLQIKEHFEKANSCRLRSLSLYKDAENQLLEELGLKGWQPNNAPVNIKQLKESFLKSGRLDAEHYQVKYDELEKRIQSVPNKTIAEIQQFNARGVQPDYIEEGCVPVVNSKHILENGLDYENFERTSESFLSSHERAQIGYGDILIYTTGANIGRTQAYMQKDYALASNHVNILRVRDVNPIYLALVLNSLIGRMQTEKLCTGSAQAELYPSDIEKFIIPILDASIQESISAKIQEGFALKAESKRFLDEAKMMVEREIEQSH